MRAREVPATLFDTANGAVGEEDRAVVRGRVAEKIRRHREKLQ